MNIIEIDPAISKDARRFLDLPFRLYRQTPQWVPPLEMDIRRMLDRRRHPFYAHSQAAFFLALDDSGQTLGRIVALDNHNYNEFNHERKAFFYLFECENDSQTALGLVEAASSWAAARGLDRLYGPKGFTALDGMGLLVNGFELRPAMGIPYNLAYYAGLLEQAGFVSQGDTLSGYMHRSIRFPEKILQVAKAVQEKKGLVVARYRTRADLEKLIPKLRGLYNASIQGTPGNAPLTEDEAATMAGQLLWFADPKLIKIVMKDDEPVGFLFAYPDISAAIQRSAGRLLPFGWADALLELRRTKVINVNGAGMVEKYRGMGGTALLFAEMYHSVIENRYEHLEIVQIGAANDRMMNEMRNFGIDFNKAHRMYEKNLAAA